MVQVLNPFKSRVTESAADAPAFMQVFAQGILDLPALRDILADNTYILSSPGGGKTTLLSLFLPRNVVNLVKSPPVSGDKDEGIVEWARRERVIGATRANVAGLRISCTGALSSVARLSAEPSAKERFFLASLNAKVVLDGLFALQVVLEQDENHFLDTARLQPPDDWPAPPGFPKNPSARELRTWAERIDASCGEAIDSVLPVDKEAMPGHADFIGPVVLNPKFWSMPGVPWLEHVLIMLDDVHDLEKEQLRTVYQQVFPKRSQGARTWFAARTAISDQFDPTRDFINERDGRRIVLEESWAQAEKEWRVFTRTVADKRARLSSSRVASFSSHVDGSIHASMATTVLKELTNARERVRRKITNEAAALAITERIGAVEDTWKQLVHWRAVEAQLETRTGMKTQALVQMQAPPEPLGSPGAALLGAAELFLHNESGFPYYYGMHRLSALGFYNTEQFLAVAAPLYEFMLDREANDEASFEVSPEHQHKIVEATSRKFIKERLERLDDPAQVANFIEGAGRLLHEATFRRSAPYPPGATHIAILEQDYDALRNSNPTRSDVGLVRNVLNAAASENVVRIAPGSRIVKDRKWRFIEMNPLYMVRFGLPVSSSHCQHVSIPELASWAGGVFTEKSRRTSKALGIGLDTSASLLDDFDQLEE